MVNKRFTDEQIIRANNIDIADMLQKQGEKITEKQVAYNEESGNKTAIVESIEMPVVEGAIVVAKGANSVDIKSRIASAISAITNLPVYKIQVFEKGE